MAGSNKLTDTTIKQAKPRDKAYPLSDGRSMYLEVMPTGAKYWRMKYHYNRKENTLSIGVYPSVTLKKAREVAEAARAQLAAGIDPNAKKKQDKLARITSAGNSFDMVAQEWFDKHIAQLSDSHKTRTKGILKNNLSKYLGSRPISEITPQELLAALRKTEARGIHETAKRALQTAGQIFRYAVATSKAERDIAFDLKGALTPPKRKHFAAITDPAELSKLLVSIDGYVGTPEVKAALLLSALLFQRPGEIRYMEWNEINWKEERWEIPAEKMKMKQPHIVPLCQQSLNILHQLQPLTGHRKYVFPSAKGGNRPLSDNGVRAALRTMGYTKEQHTPHGFRATARTILDEILGYPPHLIEHQIAHAVKDTNGRAYNRTKHLLERKKMMQGWADYLDGLRNPTNYKP